MSGLPRLVDCKTHRRIRRIASAAVRRASPASRCCARAPSPGGDGRRRGSATGASGRPPRGSACPARAARTAGGRARGSRRRCSCRRRWHRPAAPAARRRRPSRSSRSGSSFRRVCAWCSAAADRPTLAARRALAVLAAGWSRLQRFWWLTVGAGSRRH